MPVISRFYGIVIAMYFNDHNPLHFHAKYSGHEALFNFQGNVLEGELPRRASRMVADWIELHGNELQDNWQKARSGEPLSQIEPLE